MATTTTGAPLDLFTPINNEILITDEIVNQNMNIINNFADSVGKPNGIAGLDQNGKIYPMPTAEDIGAAPINSCPVGSVFIFLGDIAADGFLLCQGQAISRTIYKELFALIGTTYGSGDGGATFNLPDLRGKTPVGYNGGDTYFNSLGKTGGTVEQELRALIGSCDGRVDKISYCVAPASHTSYYGMHGGWSDPYVGEINPVNHSTYVYQSDGSKPNVLQPYITVNYMVRY